MVTDPVTGLALKGGTKAAVEALKTGYTKIRDRIHDARLAKMVEQVAARIETDPMGAADRINEAIRTEWGYKLIERTFRDLMDSINTNAEIAIAAMMAEYIADMRGPDREYQLAGGFLVGADEEVLRGTSVIASQFVELYATAPASLPGGKHNWDTFTLLRGQGQKAADEVWFFRRTANEIDKATTDSNGETIPPNLGIVLRLLERQEFGALPGGGPTTSATTFSTEKHPGGGSTCFHVLVGAEARLARLHRYLCPALVEQLDPSS